MATTTMAMDVPAPYPVRLDVPYPESLSRWLIFIKWLLVIPHLVIVYFLSLALAVTTFIAFLSILFTQKYPEGLFNFAVGVQRWSQNTVAYYWLLRDVSAFSMDAGNYPVAFEAEHPVELNRWLPLIKWLLVIPVLLAGFVVLIAAYFTTIIAWFAILFTGKYPRGLFDFAVGALRWSARVNAYTNLWTDRYPPFSMDA